MYRDSWMFLWDFAGFPQRRLDGTIKITSQCYFPGTVDHTSKIHARAKIYNCSEEDTLLWAVTNKNLLSPAVIDTN